MFRLGAACIGYAFGCFQTAFFITKLYTGKDIRTLGSGTAGSANVATYVSPSAGWLTLLGDLLKTLLAIWFCRGLFDGHELLAGIYGGVGVVVGHVWPATNRFKGGKGVACTVALMLSCGGIAILGAIGI